MATCCGAATWCGVATAAEDLGRRVRFEGRSSAAEEEEASEVTTCTSELEVAPEGPPDWRCLKRELL